MVNYGTTVEQLIKIYLYKKGDIKLINSYDWQKNASKLYFSYKGMPIKFGEQEFVENYFKGGIPKITIFGVQF